MSRFDYVAYDSGAAEDQKSAKDAVAKLEKMINAIGYTLGPDEHKKIARSKSLALTKLEECYMWIGKAIRDDQLCRNSSTVLQEERTNA